MRITGFLTTPPQAGPAAKSSTWKLRHRRHARVEDRIRAGEDTGMRNLTFHDLIRERSVGCERGAVRCQRRGPRVDQ